jgi:hemerythrin-like domain-containing protein
MNTATQNLENDHVYILQLTDVMEQMAKKRASDVNHLKSVVHIIRNYADGLHHKKEEDLLFPLFEQRSANGGCGPVGVMLMEHKQGREYVQGMVDYIAAYEKGDEEALELVFENMLNYAALLKNHIFKENNILFRMADDAFSEADQKMLLDQFEKIEKDANPGDKAENFIKAIKELSSNYSSSI